MHLKHTGSCFHENFSQLDIYDLQLFSNTDIKNSCGIIQFKKYGELLIFMRLISIHFDGHNFQYQCCVKLMNLRSPVNNIMCEYTIISVW